MCAFSISSRSRTLYGFFRIESVSSPPCSKPMYPGGAPISLATACFSIYSLMSKRINSTPRIREICLATSVFPTPVGPVNRKEPIGLSGAPSPARDRLMEVVSDFMADSWPNTTCLSSPSSVSSFPRSEVETLRLGILAILATIFSISDG